MHFMRQIKTLLALSLFCSSLFAADPALMNLVMPDAKSMAGVQVDQTQLSPFGQYLLSQFQTNPGLDKSYTPFGRVVAGLSVVRALKVGEPVIEPDVMTRVQILADMPQDQRPKVVVLDPHSKAFASLIAKARQDKGSDYTICDVDIPSVVK